MNHQWGETSADT